MEAFENVSARFAGEEQRLVILLQSRQRGPAGRFNERRHHDHMALYPNKTNAVRMWVKCIKRVALRRYFR